MVYEYGRLVMMDGKQVAQCPVHTLGSEEVPLLVTDTVAVFKKSFKCSFPPHTFLASLTQWPAFTNCWNQSFGLDQCLPTEPLLECKSVCLLSSHAKVETELSRYRPLGGVSSVNTGEWKVLCLVLPKCVEPVLVERGGRAPRRKAGEYLSRPNLA